MQNRAVEHINVLFMMTPILSVEVQFAPSNERIAVSDEEKALMDTEDIEIS